MDGEDANQHHEQQQWMAAMQQQYQYQQQQQQQWMSMQYPAAAMAMQYGQQYASFYHHQQAQQQYQQDPQKQFSLNRSSGEDNHTIWVGDLQPWMDEGYLHSCFVQSGDVLSVKVIRNKQTGNSEGYGFVEFSSHTSAENVLQCYNGTAMPNAQQPFHLNWAGLSTDENRAADPSAGSDLSIFVGNLGADVTDTLLCETFSCRYSTVKGAKVVYDTNSGQSKGYGFVRFGDENERSCAIAEMNGVYCSNRPMRIGVATPKKPSTSQQFSSQAVVLAGGYASSGAIAQAYESDNDLSNTTIFVGGIDSDVTEEDLHQAFCQIGRIIAIKIPVGKRCGFVQFESRSSAEEAIQKLNGSVIGHYTVRLSWGRTPANKQQTSRAGGYGYGGSSANGSGHHYQPFN